MLFYITARVNKVTFIIIEDSPTACSKDVSWRGEKIKSYMKRVPLFYLWKLRMIDRANPLHQDAATAARAGLLSASSVLIWGKVKRAFPRWALQWFQLQAEKHKGAASDGLALLVGKSLCQLERGMQSRIHPGLGTQLAREGGLKTN